MAKKFGLSRGMADILGENYVDVAPETAQAEKTEIDVNLIDANPWQPRTEFEDDKLEELSASIKANGIIQPLVLRRNGERYQIIAGERRFRAAKKAGLTAVPAVIRELDDSKMLEVALIENIQRADLNPIEEAISYQRLIEECQVTQEEMANRVGKNRSTITNFLRLLKLPKEIQEGLRRREITMGHARALINIEDEATQIMLYQQTVEYGYSVRRVEELVREYNERGEDVQEEPAADAVNDENKKKSSLSNEYVALKNQLSEKLGAKVKFQRAESGKGKITIPFASDADLERIISVLDKL
ncbi:MAG: ParB/RepB/Spo0J family partition protein [Bacteroidales bacterium]|jgi:ParB family chromosome partitioning protein|nr:ParB/RepB/Spo0J family partition protein [Bacteroidales bacterium]